MYGIYTLDGIAAEVRHEGRHDLLSEDHTTSRQVVEDLLVEALRRSTTPVLPFTMRTEQRDGSGSASLWQGTLGLFMEN